jgi:hypothetical protein
LLLAQARGHQLERHPEPWDVKPPLWCTHSTGWRMPAFQPGQQSHALTLTVVKRQAGL